MLVEKFNYPTLTREMIGGSRHYTDGVSKPVPSVTTVLDKTADKTHLYAWRKRVGEAEAARISRESAGAGTRMHNALERYILGKDWDEFGNNMGSQIARTMTVNIIEQGLVQVDEIWGTEVKLLAPDLYAGTTDAVGVFRGVPTIIDFKNVRRMKKPEWITDYYLQGILYALAHNEMFDTDIQQVAILMADWDGNYQDFVISGHDFEHHKLLAAERLQQYYSENPT